MAEQPQRHLRRDQGVAARRGPDRLDEQRRAGVLEQEPAGPVHQRGVDVLVEVEGGDDDDAERVGSVGPGQEAGCLEAVELGHADVEEADVGSQVTRDGQQIIVRVVHPGDLFGFTRALGRSDYPGTATAAVDSLVAAWPTTSWDGFVEDNPHLAMNAIRTIGQRLDEAHTRIREMSTEEVERRVAHAVLRLVEQAGKRDEVGLRVDFPISRRDIAEMTGTTLHTVSRILSAWETQGLVEGGRQKLVVRDRAGLSRLAENAE